MFHVETDYGVETCHGSLVDYSKFDFEETYIDSLRMIKELCERFFNFVEYVEGTILKSVKGFRSSPIFSSHVGHVILIIVIHSIFFSHFFNAFMLFCDLSTIRLRK
jgi:hypothetical protein